MFLTLALASSMQAAPSRFLSVGPLSGLPWIKIDHHWTGASYADEASRRQGLQGRVLWIDGSANLGAVNTAEKIVALLSKVKDVGFNTVVLDVKPIVGRTLYPSSLTKQMTSWKGQTLPDRFDPV